MQLRHGLFGLTLTSALALAAFAANAADMYVPGPGGLKDGPVWTPEWAGFYIGVNGGYSWSEVDIKSNAGFTSPFFGGQAGYNFQRGAFVFGAEVDAQGTGNGSGSNTPITLGGKSFAISINDWGTVAARGGYTIGSALFFVKGGFAWGDVDAGTQGISGVSPAFGTFTPTGYEIGGGIEYKIAPSWSLKIEYQHVDLGNISFTNPLTGKKATDDVAFNAVMLGANWHIGNWGGDDAPLK